MRGSEMKFLSFTGRSYNTCTIQQLLGRTNVAEIELGNDHLFSLLNTKNVFNSGKRFINMFIVFV
jgi:hypothetical protein